MLQNKSNLVLILLVIGLFSSNSFAGLINITPNVGYKNETLKLTDLSGAETQAKMNQPFYGLKVGLMTSTGVSLDVSGQIFSGKGTATQSGIDFETDFNHKAIAALIGVTAMNTFKISIGYILFNELSVKDLSSGTEAAFKGPGYQVGLGINLTQSISANLQYEIFQFNQVQISPSTSYQDIKDVFKSCDSQALSLNVGMSF